MRIKSRGKAEIGLFIISVFFCIVIVSGYLKPGNVINRIIAAWPQTIQEIIGEDDSFRNSIPKIVVNHDQDQDGLADPDDIIQGARKDAANKPAYRSAYYNGGYPPDNEGVCTDVIWRAFRNAGYDLKKMVDEDIRKNLKAYPRVEMKPDPNIDFRRVPNLIAFFTRHATVLTNELIPYDAQNLAEWQGGDIIVFAKPVEHIGIVSDKRRADGVPYITHNAGPYTREEDAILYWQENVSKIIGHFRWPKQ